MTRRAQLVFPAAAVGLIGLASAVASADTPASAATPASPAPPADATREQLLQEIRSLQSRVQRLENATSRPSTDAVDKAVADHTVAQVLADAERRSALPPILPTAGFIDGKFVLRSEDGRYSLRPYVLLQARYVVNNAGGSPDDGGSSTESGFEIRRLRLGLTGSLDRFDYRFIWGTNRSTGAVALDDAEVRYNLGEGWTISGGQFRDPVHHEELVNIGKQLAVDRSLVNELVGGGYTDRVQGITLAHEQGLLNTTLVLHDGINSDNTNFTDGDGSQWGVAGRVEYIVTGDSKAYGDFSARGNKSALLAFGLGGDVSGVNGANSWTWTADAQWENTSGVGVYGAVLGRTLVAHHGDADTTVGAIAQIGWLLPDSKWELFCRWGWIRDDSDIVRSDTVELTVGANFFIAGHDAKLTADLTYLPNGSLAVNGEDIVDSGSQSQVVARVQFQLAM